MTSPDNGYNVIIQCGATHVHIHERDYTYFSILMRTYTHTDDALVRTCMHKHEKDLFIQIYVVENGYVSDLLHTAMPFVIMMEANANYPSRTLKILNM